MHRFAAFEYIPVAVGRLGVVDIKHHAADPFRGKLAIECRAVDRRLAVVGLRVSRCAGLGCAAKPVVCAGQGGRAFRDIGDAGEVFCAGLGIVQPAKRVPAGVEFGISGVDRAFCRVRCCDAIGGLHVSVVGQFARQDAPLQPPCVCVDDGSAVGRRLEHDGGCVGKLLLPPQQLRVREGITGRALRRGNGLEQRSCVLLAPNDCRPGLGQLFGVGEARYPVSRVDALGIEHPFHPGAVVGDLKDGAELLDDTQFVARLELLGAPEWRKHGPRFADLAKGRMRPREEEHAFHCLRRAVSEGGDGLSGLELLAIERSLAVAPQRACTWPGFQHRGRCGDVGARHVVAAPHGDRPNENAMFQAGFGKAVAYFARYCGSTLRQRVEPALQRNDVCEAAVGYAISRPIGQHDRGSGLGIDVCADGCGRHKGKRCGDERKAVAARGAHGVDHSPVLARYQEERVRESLSVGGEADVNERLARAFELHANRLPHIPLPLLDGGTMVRRLAFG